MVRLSYVGRNREVWEAVLIKYDKKAIVNIGFITGFYFYLYSLQPYIYTAVFFYMTTKLNSSFIIFGLKLLNFNHFHYIFRTLIPVPKQFLPSSLTIIPVLTKYIHVIQSDIFTATHYTNHENFFESLLLPITKLYAVYRILRAKWRIRQSAPVRSLFSTTQPLAEVTSFRGSSSTPPL